MKEDEVTEIVVAIREDGKALSVAIRSSAREDTYRVRRLIKWVVRIVIIATIPGLVHQALQTEPSGSPGSLGLPELPTVGL